MEVGLAIGTMIVGIVFTFIVSKYYFVKSIKKELSVFTQAFVRPFERIDENVRKELLIQYRTHDVENLCELQYLIANSGEKSITNLVNPLTIRLPEGTSFLDATILHIHPEGRDIRLSKSPNEVSVNFEVLNKREFLILKLLVNGKVEVSDITFSITGDELPPRIEPKWLDSDTLGTKSDKLMKPGLLISGLIVFSFSAALFNVIFFTLLTMPNLFVLGVFKYLSLVQPYHLAALFSFIPAGLIGFFGTMLFIAGFSGGSFPPKRRMFFVPKDKVDLIKFRMRPYFDE